VTTTTSPPADLAKRASPGSIIYGVPGRVTETSLELPHDLSLDDWAATGKLLGRVDKAARWWIGTWINYGADHFGEKHAQFVDACGYAPHTLTNLARVAREVPVLERRPELEWSHHEAVVGLGPEDRVRILDQAVRGEGGFPLTVSKVRDLARAAKRPPGAITATPEAEPEPEVAIAWQTLASRLLARLQIDHPPAQFWDETIALSAEIQKGMANV
jgi:hypothetical protein